MTILLVFIFTFFLYQCLDIDQDVRPSSIIDDAHISANSYKVEPASIQIERNEDNEFHWNIAANF